jgi:hypothetical protein
MDLDSHVMACRSKKCKSVARDADTLYVHLPEDW